MSKQKTAVEWLIQQLKQHEYIGIFCPPDRWDEEIEIMENIIQKAKEMEKKQIKDAFEGGFDFGSL